MSLQQITEAMSEMLNDEDYVEEAEVVTRPHPTYRPPGNTTRRDFFKRELLPGDFAIWLAGGYFSSYYNYGLVLQVNHERRFARIRNHNMHKITIWNTHNMVVIARYPDYSMVPAEYLRRVGIEDFERVDLDNL